jgi:hypothetical protein
MYQAMREWVSRWFSGRCEILRHVHVVGRRKIVDMSGFVMCPMLGGYGYSTYPNLTHGWNSRILSQI